MINNKWINNGLSSVIIDRLLRINFHLFVKISFALFYFLRRNKYKSWSYMMNGKHKRTYTQYAHTFPMSVHIYNTLIYIYKLCIFVCKQIYIIFRHFISIGKISHKPKCLKVKKHWLNFGILCLRNILKSQVAAWNWI